VAWTRALCTSLAIRRPGHHVCDPVRNSVSSSGTGGLRPFQLIYRSPWQWQPSWPILGSVGAFAYLSAEPAEPPGGGPCGCREMANCQVVPRSTGRAHFHCGMHGAPLIAGVGCAADDRPQQDQRRSRVVKIVGGVLTWPIVLKSRQILLCWLPARETGCRYSRETWNRTAEGPCC
jgi:hypothetical protein